MSQLGIVCSITLPQLRLKQVGGGATAKLTGGQEAIPEDPPAQSERQRNALDGEDFACAYGPVASKGVRLAYTWMRHKGEPFVCSPNVALQPHEPTPWSMCQSTHSSHKGVTFLLVLL